METSRAHLVCLDESHAEKVLSEAYREGDATHNVERFGRTVVISYFAKRYPLDVAEWAFEHGHVSEDSASRVIARL